VKTGCEGFAVGEVVMLQSVDGMQAADDGVAAEGTLGLLQALWQTATGAAMPAENLWQAVALVFVLFCRCGTFKLVEGLAFDLIDGSFAGESCGRKRVSHGLCK